MPETRKGEEDPGGLRTDWVEECFQEEKAFKDCFTFKRIDSVKSMLQVTNKFKPLKQWENVSSEKMETLMQKGEFRHMSRNQK